MLPQSITSSPNVKPIKEKADIRRRGTAVLPFCIEAVEGIETNAALDTFRVSRAGAARRMPAGEINGGSWW